MKSNPYIYFNGNCEEVLKYWAEALGGNVVMMLQYGQLPSEESNPGIASDKIMHGRIEFGGNTIMGSDAPPDRFQKPQGFSVSVSVDTAEEAETLYTALSDGGKVFMPLGETFWAHRFAMFEDKFGIDWMVNCEKAM